MRRAHRVGAGWAVALMFLGALALPAIADWNPEDPYKWVQYPDLTPLGIDVNTSFPPYLLADDFLCTQPGPLTQIHIWGSWYHDELPFGGDPLAVRFTLSIHKDIPASQNPDGYSIPGELLWIYTLEPGQFSARIWHEGTPEGWLDPPELYEFPADYNCWQYNFMIPEPEAFYQEGTPDQPVIYWLDVQAEVLDPEFRFGWKTSMDHWNDDAVWGDGAEPYDGPWYELRYPQGHEQYGQSIDLAFVIQGGEEPQGEDFGDAPDSYRTLLGTAGPHHVIVPGMQLGNLIDGEPDGQPDPNALGDDNNNLPDEDGVAFITPFVPGQSANLNVTASAPGYLQVWFDFDGDGTFAQASNQVVMDQLLVPGVNPVAFGVPGTAVLGQTFARFRYSTVAGLGYSGPAPDGEVEDYEIQIVTGEPTMDFGDAPDPVYPTWLSSNGARHMIWPGMFLGAGVDAEPDGQPDPNALGDDNDGNDDEDGVVFTSPLIPGSITTVDVIASQPGRLDAWIDLDGDGTWTSSIDQIFASTPLAAGLNNLSFLVPGSATPNLQTFARFRYSSTGGLNERGQAQDGEVEDYEVWIDEPQPELDFGDAPDPSYPTWLSSNGARHFIVPGFMLGNSVDSEPDGQPDPNALGDDNDGNNDDDGVIFTSPLIPGGTATVDVIAPGGGILDAWLDFAGDGSWAQAGDQIFVNHPLTPGLNSLSFGVPVGIGGHASFARFRLSANGGLSYDGLAPEGEVEDYQVFIDEGRASIGDRVWEDLDMNGLQDTGEPGKPGVVVTLLDAASNAIGTTTTDAAGNYWFTGLVPGSYALQFALPAGYVFSPQDQGGDDTIDSDADPTTGLTLHTFLAPGQVDLTWDAGLVLPANAGLGDRVWDDLNLNGIQDAGEPGLGGVQVDLTDSLGNIIATAFTAPDGSYGFGGLAAGSYLVRFYLLPGYIWSPQDQGADDTVDSDADANGYTPWIALTAGQVDTTWDAGMRLPLLPDFKWEQRPDLSVLGIDVNDTAPYILADDFLCDASGLITEIHLWASWRGDYLPYDDPTQVMFGLSFHKDIPAEDNPDGYSMPGELLWAYDVGMGQFFVERWAVNIEEGWLDPPAGYSFPADWTCWHYVFHIEPEFAFHQYGTPDNPVVFWLDAQAYPLDPEALFGWKTSIDHWNDDAVWGQGGEPYGGPWDELRYPPGHEQQGQSIDLAFALVSEDAPLDLDFGDAPDPTYRTLLANDGARHQIVPTGLILGASIDSDPDGQPNATATGDDNDGNDDEDGVNFTSSLIPGQTATVDVIAPAGGVLDAWIDFADDGSWAQAVDAVFASQPLAPGTNSLSFNVPAGIGPAAQTFARFRLSANGGLSYAGLATEGEVEDYEVAIEAATATLGDRVWDDLNQNGIQDTGEPGQPGVTVQLLDASSTVIATAVTNASGNYGFTGLVPGIYMLQFQLLPAYAWSPQDQGADDTVDSDVNGAGQTPWITLTAGQVDPTWDAGMHVAQAFKWEQLPDLTPLGIDVNSQEPYLLADDFLCTVSGPLTEVWVWGSWYGDYYPFDQLPDQVGFTLSIHADIPVEDNPDGFSKPGPLLWLWDFPPGSFAVEHFFEGPEGWMDPPDLYLFPADFHCWLYRFSVPADLAFRQYGNEEYPQVFWLDVQAHPLDPEARFGWKTSDMHWNDDAVWGMGPEPYEGPWEELFYPPGHEQQGQSIDLAFGLHGEDLPLSLDFGDAPDPGFPTLLASNGARHVLESGMFLGSSVDSEPDGQPDATATGDDNDGNDDEDGVLFVSALIPGGTAQVEVMASRPGLLDAWIDFDGNGAWTPDETIFVAEPLVPGINLLGFAVPANGLAGHLSMARFRYSLSGAATPRGIAYGGEVEDYEVWIDDDTTESPDALPERFGLKQNMPNPFNPVTLIGVDVPAGGGNVRLEVFDLAGRRVATLMDGFTGPGRHQVTWRGTDARGRELPSGVYLYRLEAPGYARTMKMLLLR